VKRLFVYPVICFLTGLLAFGCERGVRANREGEPEDYQPRPAPQEPASATKANPETKVNPATKANPEVKGELMRVDMKENNIVVRASNGMEQTFKFNDETMVHGIKNRGMRDLMGKEGSEVTVAWTDEAGAKMATMIDVNDLVSKRKKR
jgi:hypothetical protein